MQLNWITYIIRYQLRWKYRADDTLQRRRERKCRDLQDLRRRTLEILILARRHKVVSTPSFAPLPFSSFCRFVLPPSLSLSSFLPPSRYKHTLRSLKSLIALHTVVWSPTVCRESVGVVDLTFHRSGVANARV